MKKTAVPPVSRCRACLHPDRALIDGLLILETPMREVEKHYGLSRSTLSRHWRDHIPDMLDVDADTARDVKQTESDILAAAQVIRMLITVFRCELSPGAKLAAGVYKLIEGLWNSFPFAEGPQGDMQAAIIRATGLLQRLSGREFVFGQGTDGDLREAQRSLEEWGRYGEGQDETV